MVKTMSIGGGILTPPWLTSVDDLVFYAIDKASPYNLGLRATLNK
jgi:hypothetical protein